MKSFKNYFLICSVITLFSTNAYSMGAKKPAIESKAPVVKEVLKTAVTQAATNVLPLFWNVNTGTAGNTTLGRTLPLIENLLPLFSSVSPVLSTVLPIITTVARARTQINRPQQSQTSETFGGPYLDHIKDLAENSSCAEHIWKNGSKAPAGFIKGMALSFARSSCRLKTNETAPSALVNILINAVTKKNNFDALLSYKNIFSNLGLSLSNRGETPLRAVFLLGMGTSMAENGGQYCKSTESVGSKLVSTVLSKLLSEYKGGNALRCFTDIFQEGTSCADTAVSANAFNKACPAFGAEYSATMLRLQSTKFASVANNKAEVVPACDELLRNVQDLIDQDPENACADIF